jgi:DNA replication protein DnaC
MTDIRKTLERLKKHCLSDEECQRRRREESRLAEMKMLQGRQDRFEQVAPPKYRAFDEKKLPLECDKARARMIIEWEFPESKGLYIIGPTAMGKSMAFYELIRRQIMMGKTVEAMHGLEFKVFCGKTIKEPETAMKSFKYLASVDILAIDDIAKATSPAMIEGWFYLMEKRSSWNKPVIMTANTTGDDIKQKVNDATVAEPLLRRMREFCKVVVMKPQNER